MKPALVDGAWDVPRRFNFARDVIEATAAQDPDQRALAFVDRSSVVRRLTFADLAIASAHWANLLADVGVLRGDRVLVLVGKSPDWHGILLGMLRAGAVAIPCSDMLRAKDLAFRVEHSGACLVIAERSTEAETEAMLVGLSQPPLVIYLDEARSHLHEYPPRAPFADTAATEPAFILYTSGTTKDPKGVVHTHGYTFAKRMQAEHWLDAQPGDLVWCTAGTGWAKSIWNGLLGPWSRGAEIVVHEGPFDARERLELIDHLRVTVLCQAPTEYRLMAKLGDLSQHDLSRVRRAVAAGEPLNPEVIRVFQDTFGLTIHDGYGQTENTLLVGNVVGSEVRPGSMGLPTPGHEVDVIDELGNPVAAGVEGDIALRGQPPTLFAGYWEQPDETAAVYRGDWYVTGDRAHRDEDGYFWFTGRADDVILSAAYRIGPFEVESALLEHPAVAESAVVGKPDADRGQIVKAFVVLRPGFEPSNELAGELQEHCREVTAPYKYPREIEFVDDLPKTTSGKLRRVELRQLEEQRAGAAPRRPLEVVEKPLWVEPEPEPVAEPGRAAEPPPETASAATDESYLLRQREERLQAVEEEQRRREEDRRRAAEAAESERAEAAARVEEERLRAEEERRRAEEELQRAEAERRAEEEALLRAEHEARARAEEEALLRAEQEARQQAEQAAREQEEEARRRAEDEAHAHAEEEARQRAADEARWRAEHEAFQRAEQEARMHAEEQARTLADIERRRADEDARLRAEEEDRHRYGEPRDADDEPPLQGEEVRRRAQDEAQRRAEEAWQALEEARLRAEREGRGPAAADLREHHEDEPRRQGDEQPLPERPVPEQPREPSRFENPPDVQAGTFVSRLLAYTRADKPPESEPDEPAAEQPVTGDDTDD